MATQARDAARTLTIAELNDRVRLGLDRNARIVITSNCLETLSGKDCSPIERVVVQAELMAAFRHCQFSEDSPERDFGTVELRGRKVWMKIDYYDLALEFGSEDPADASVTTRVMTILLPEDY
jgi:hypothetical protein